jgi:hypothetical protein
MCLKKADLMPKKHYLDRELKMADDKRLSPDGDEKKPKDTDIAKEPERRKREDRRKFACLNGPDRRHKGDRREA